MDRSPLQTARHGYQPKLPPILAAAVNEIGVTFGKPTESADNQSEMKQLFEKTYGTPIATFVKGTNPKIGNSVNVGVILSGGQAPGGHNVICGLLDGLKKANAGSRLFGFLGGPSGLLEDKAVEITADFADSYRNTGGFDMIGSGRTKIETAEQFDAVLAVCAKRKLQAVVVIGGDDSNTNAALMAEFFAKRGSTVQVIGVPKTIDGDLKNEYIETSFGFDTATKTYSELIGNIARDANSAKKYWHFIKLMGRSASHIALECALETRPNVCIISEEVEQKKQTLGSIVNQIADVVARRADNGENFGIALIPEGLIEFIPEIKRLISELNDLLAKNKPQFEKLGTFESQRDWVGSQLDAESATVFSRLPAEIQRQLLMDRDPHGNVQVSRIETEKLLTQMVEAELSNKKRTGTYRGTFSSLTHFFGYEGRCAFPSNFDADYCYSLGFTAFALIASGVTGYLASVRNLSRPAREWQAGGIPLTMMMNMEQRHGQMKPVIRKALVELDGAPFAAFEQNRNSWAVTTSYLYPGAIQYYGPDEVCNRPTLTIEHEQR
ncbi:MAG TPA: diphosphate--fructose-6-phosphate 1-phosphotransferase [Spirochaetia bacterium]|nr:diphosphate--fructose-6-phosphate 1-phosphotransferase [Spirochaetia bacterium]